MSHRKPIANTPDEFISHTLGIAQGALHWARAPRL
jgi:hypothetical protein